MVLTLAGGSWTAARAPLPANAAGDQQVQLRSVSCPSVSSCTAIGESTEGSLDALLLTFSAGYWTAARAPLPGGDSTAYLSDVSCLSATSCIVVGTSFDTSDNNHGLILTRSG